MAKSKPKPDNVEVHIHDSSMLKGSLKAIGGSMSDDWNNTLANQAVGSLWLKNFSDEHVKRTRHATVDALIGIGPRDEFEGMAAAQFLAAHNAAMECYRRAMISEQSFEGRRENLSQANKLSRTYTTLLDALNKHRGKGQQKVTVEHVHVHAGGQAVVGVVAHPGEGIGRKRRINPMQSKLPMHLSKRCLARTRSRNLCASAAMPNGRCRMHGGLSTGAPKGNSNALKHGRYTADFHSKAP